MASFETTIQDPNEVTGSIPARESTAAAIGAALSGVARIGAMGLQASQDAREKRVTGAIEGELHSEIQAFAGTPLAGESVDPNAEAAAASPGFQSTNRELDRLRQAERSGMSRQEFLTRVSAITARAVAENPRFATEIRSRAQEVLGFSPQSAMVSLEMTEQEYAAERNRQAETAAGQFALSAGYDKIDPATGERDWAYLGREGMRLMANEYNIKDLKSRLELTYTEGQINAQRAGPAPTAAERTDMEIRSFVNESQSDQYYDTFVRTWIEETLPSINPNDPASIEAAQASFGVRRTALRDTIGRWADMAGVGNEARVKIMERYENNLKIIDDLFIGPHASPQLVAQGLQMMRDQIGRDAIQAAPGIARANALGADMTFIFDRALHTNTDLSVHYETEATNALTGVATNRNPTPGQTFDNTMGALNGDYPVYTLPSTEERVAALRPVIRQGEVIVSRGAMANDRDLFVFGNVLDSVTGVTVNSNNKDNTKRAAATVGNPAWLATWSKMESNPQFAETVARVGPQMYDLAQNSLRQNLRTMETYTVGMTLGPRVGGSAEREMFSYAPKYNPQLGKIEIVATRVSGTSPVTGVDPRVMRHTPRQLQEDVDAMNAALNLAATTRQHGEAEVRAYTDLQLKQSLILTEGSIGIREGARIVPMPEVQSSQQAASFNDAVSFVFDVEGGETIDSGGYTNMGISSIHNPDIDVANLTRETAAQVYKDRYWDRIGADDLPPDLATVAFDASVNQGVDNAKRWITASGGDIDTYLLLRRAHYEKLARDNPDEYGQYLRGWNDRLDRLEAHLNPPQVQQASGGINIEVIDG